MGTQVRPLVGVPLCCALQLSPPRKYSVTLGVLLNVVVTGACHTFS